MKAKLSRLAILAVTICALVAISCNTKGKELQTDEGQLQGNIYENKQLGWKITVPQGWDLMGKSDNAGLDKKGSEAIEQSSGVKVDMSSLKHLVSFQKDKFNMFLSSSEPYKEETPGDYDARAQQVANMIYNAYVGKGIKADTSSGTETIDGLAFHAFYATIYGQDGKPVLNQILYSRLVNGYDLSVSINYNNDKDKGQMLTAFQNSTFTKP